MIDVKEIMLRLTKNNMALERVAYNYEELTLEDLPQGIIESPGALDSCLIEVRENKKMLDLFYKVQGRK